MASWSRYSFGTGATLPAEARSTGDDEADLRARAADDREAFARLYDRYVEAIYPYCYRRLGHEEQHRDADRDAGRDAVARWGCLRPAALHGWAPPGVRRLRS